MCGRFVRKATLEEIAEAFDLDVPGIDLELTPSYNVAPGQRVAAAVCDRGRTLKQFKWGLVPFWAKDEKIGYRMINARAETVAEKPGFKRAFAKRRCIVVADGFYEWQQAGKTKVPHYVHLKSGKPLGFAGLYEHWRSPDGRTLDTCTIITTSANALMRPIHDRMPVILDREACGAWLDPEATDPQILAGLLAPFDPDRMEAYQVGPLVNSPRNDSPECIEPRP
ncbi:MAG: SOS response-associated peptidase [Candidatus Edwardsbacteria bacterium]|jgi:putative SOS response-associated peptidase YedK|nr:SOS response-associated peptidase [Candidatus Edwardsbacteria bacterium]